MLLTRLYLRTPIQRYSLYEAGHFGVFDLISNLDSIVKVISVNRKVGDRPQSRVASREAWKASVVDIPRFYSWRRYLAECPFAGVRST